MIGLLIVIHHNISLWVPHNRMTIYTDTIRSDTGIGTGTSLGTYVGTEEYMIKPCLYSGQK